MILMRSIAAMLLAATVVACGGEAAGPGDLTPIATLTITSVPDTLLTRQRVRLEAQAVASDGSVLADRALTWASSDSSVASVTPGGVLTAVAPGAAVIRVSADSVVDSIAVSVRALTFVHITVGTSVACGLEAAGDAWCWGNVGAQGYGNGSLDSSRVAVPLRAAKGYAFRGLVLSEGSACGIELSGRVACWGRNDSAEVGIGTTGAVAVPSELAGLSGVAQLAAGNHHFCARTAAGAVSCWGSNEWKQAGQSSRALVTRPQPVALAGAATDVTAEGEFSCALVAGQGFCWGADYSRQLGNDTTYDRLVPVRAANGDGLNRAWSEVEANTQHTCGRDVSGGVFCWGVMEGSGNRDTLVWLPAQRFPGVTATDIGVGWFVQCAVSLQQDVWCGGNAWPLVKLATTTPVKSVVVADLPCVLDTAGAVSCAQLDAPHDQLAPVALPSPALQLAASDGQTCALSSPGTVTCWPMFERLPFDTLDVTGVYAGSGSRICVLTASNAVVCWRPFGAPLEVIQPAGGLQFTSLAVGNDQTCGLTAAGAAWCWGVNAHGQLGDGTTASRAAPVPVQGGQTFRQLTAGDGFTCGVTTVAEIWCWGRGSWGNMGDDHRDESASPVTVDGIPVLAAVSQGCGLDLSGAAWCWPTAPNVPTPQKIGGAIGLASINGHCGLRPDGGLRCWGSNYSGQFGNGTYGNSYATAVAAGGNLAFTEVSVGLGGSACGIALDGATWCWGSTYQLALPSPDAGAGYATLPLRIYGGD